MLTGRTYYILPVGGLWSSDFELVSTRRDRRFTAGSPLRMMHLLNVLEIVKKRGHRRLFENAIDEVCRNFDMAESMVVYGFHFEYGLKCNYWHYEKLSEDDVRSIYEYVRDKMIEGTVWDDPERGYKSCTLKKLEESND